MAPKSPAYDPLVIDHPLGNLKQSKRSSWKKSALGASLLLALVWLLVPREKWRNLPSWNESSSPTPNECAWTGIPGSESTDPTSSGVVQPPVKALPIHADEDIHHPTSFETDRDPTKTTYCTTPHSSADRLVQYALMLDAGSTGSRIHIYKFNNCGPQPAYEYEVFKMTRPDSGLSSFAGRPVDAAASLDILMEEAMRVVPVSLQKCTPVAVRATAGLRRLPGSQSVDILNAVTSHLRDAYPFALPAIDAVTIVDGADHAIFAWVTANHLLGMLRADAPPKSPTFALLDLGGASTQIVFEPTGDAPLLEGEHKYDLDFGNKKRVLYWHSHLGYGLMHARLHVHRVVDSMAALHTGLVSAGAMSTPIVSNPCISRNTHRIVELRLEDRTRKTVDMDGGDVGGFDACARIVDLVLAKNATCAVPPCSFGGAFQPPLSEAFPASAGRVLLLSYFYDRVTPLLLKSQNDMQLTATVDTIANLAQKVCRGRDEWLKEWGAQPAVMMDLEQRPEWCLDLTFIHRLLRIGYEFDDSREVMFGKKIAGTELAWCLGASLQLVAGGNVQCGA